MTTLSVYLSGIHCTAERMHGRYERTPTGKMKKRSQVGAKVEQAEGICVTAHWCLVMLYLSDKSQRVVTYTVSTAPQDTHLGVHIRLAAQL